MDTKIKRILEYVFVIDKSKSMRGYEKMTADLFNLMLEKQGRSYDETYVSTVLFDTESTVIYDRVTIDKVKKMTKGDYTANGGTALVDALGDAIHRTVENQKQLIEEDFPMHTVFVIVSDGNDDSSSKYSVDEVKTAMEKLIDNCRYEFIFAGTSKASMKAAKKIGILDDFIGTCSRILRGK